MPEPFTLKRLTDVEDLAPSFGASETQEARFAHHELDAEQTGVSLMVVKPGCRQAFAHRHEQVEEVYVVVSGSGRVKLDDEIVELAPLDALRVAPVVTRQFEGGEDGIQFLAFGPRRKGDGEIVNDWWTD